MMYLTSLAESSYNRVKAHLGHNAPTKYDVRASSKTGVSVIRK